MATHKSSEKRARQDLKRAARNHQIRGRVKTWEKKVLKAAQEKSADLTTLLSHYTKKIMQAVARGAIKKQTASRKLSRVHLQANKLAGL